MQINFKDLNTLIQAKFNEYCQGNLYRLNISGDTLWEAYISGFKQGDDPVFRNPESSTHTCNNDKNFVRRYGNIVGLKEGKMVSMWDVNVSGSIFESPIAAMMALINSASLEAPYVESYETLNQFPYSKIKKADESFQLGFEKTDIIYTKENCLTAIPFHKYTFYHFNVALPRKHVNFSNDSIESIVGKLNSTRGVFKRGLEEFSTGTLELTLDLMTQGSLRESLPYKVKVEEFLSFKTQYELAKAKGENLDFFIFEKVSEAKFPAFRNELIGVFCQEVQDDSIGLEKAWINWNKRIDPVNFMQTTAPVSKKQIQQAEDELIELGYGRSFERTFATLRDIYPIATHFKNEFNVEKKMKLFGEVESTTVSKKVDFKGISEVSLETFLADILPTATGVELYVENKQLSNFMTITKPVNPEKVLTKWPNGLCWTYKGNLTGKSEIANNVEKHGGKLEGILRCSIMWAGNTFSNSSTDNSDLDLHCENPVKLVYFGDKQGILDVDIIQPNGKKAVENCIFQTLKNGVYKFRVHQYTARDSKGFKAELAFDGQVFQYSYHNGIKHKQYVDIATVTVKDGLLNVVHHLPFTEDNTPKKVWGIDTEQFHALDMICTSPNHWEGEFGKKHYFFLVNGMHPTESLKGFHVEFLNNDLMPHKRALELLSKKTQVEPNGSGLSGLGFAHQSGAEIILKVKGTHSRIMKVKI